MFIRGDHEAILTKTPLNIKKIHLSFFSKKITWYLMVFTHETEMREVSRKKIEMSVKYGNKEAGP